MKKLSLAIIFLCASLALAAQDAIRVNFQGAQPTITDFLLAYLNTISDVNDLDECDMEGVAMYDVLRTAFFCQNEGIELDEGETLTIDKKNGYLLFELRYDDDVSRIEMCYWNEADGRHKLFACVRETYSNGRYVCGQFDNWEFFRYNNATKTMLPYDSEETGIDAAYCMGDNGFYSFKLPRTGKDIIVTKWNIDGTKQQKTLKWNGYKFIL